MCDWGGTSRASPSRDAPETRSRLPVSSTQHEINVQYTGTIPILHTLSAVVVQYRKKQVVSCFPTDWE